LARTSKTAAAAAAAAPAPDHPAAADPAERGGGNRSRRMRLRAAWMYFIEDMTQSEIAQHLGVGRVTVVRLLSDARERNEIQFSIAKGLPECVDVERELEQRFGLQEAIVVPVSDPASDATLPISAATGEYLSGHVRPGMKIGVGWGRTLLESLGYIQETPLPDLSVVSLLGGITKVKRFNPAEFAWRFSRLFQAECYLMTAPAIVDAPDTRRTLIERCGLAEMFDMARSLDSVLLSVGNIANDGTAYRDGFVSDVLRRSMIQRGAVGDMLFHFFDAAGQEIDHPIHDCVMSVPVQVLRKVPARILSSGGLAKAQALLGGLRYLKPTVLVTDEHAARRVLELDRSPPAA
jgi:DNA-binding transcriptional regulator LsrR (DeoR family)